MGLQCVVASLEPGQLAPAAGQLRLDLLPQGLGLTRRSVSARSRSSSPLSASRLSSSSTESGVASGSLGHRAAGRHVVRRDELGEVADHVDRELPQLVDDELGPSHRELAVVADQADRCAWSVGQHRLGQDVLDRLRVGAGQAGDAPRAGC